MKKLLIGLALFSVTLNGMAQEDPTLKYSVATNSFWSNWFVQANFAYTAFYSNEEKGTGWSKSPFKDFRRGLGFSAAIGKWFTPGIGLRTKFSGVWGKSVWTEDADANKVKYWNLQEQTLLNLSNLLCGYNETRVWNFIPYFGVGVARNCSYNTYELVGSAGILNTFRLSKRVLLNLDLSYNLCGDDFEGEEHFYRGDYLYGGHKEKNHDRWITAEVGLTINLGKVGWNKVPDVDAIKQLSQSQIDALKAQLADANAENERLKNMLANQPKEEVPASVKEFINAPVSVFFDLDKTNIRELRDLVNVQSLAKYAADNNSNLLVTGYADSATGSVPHNQWLSEQRANRVADEIVKMGVSEDKIEKKAMGGVDILSPISYNRRATVQIVE